MKIALITPHLTYPPVIGYDLRIWQLARTLSQASDGDLEVLLLEERYEEKRRVPLEGRIKWIPLPLVFRYGRAILGRRSPILLRLISGIALLPLLINLNWLEYIIILITKRGCPKVLEVIKEMKPDIVVLVNYLYLAGFVPLIRELGIRVVVDLQNVESQVAQDLNREVRSWKSYVLWKIRERFARCLEQRFLALSDELWAPSLEDAQRIEKITKAISVKVVPNAVDLERYKNNFREKANTICFVGYYTYPPNLKAAHLLIEQIYPIVKRYEPSATLYLVGRNPSPYMLKVACQEKKIIVTGEVKDALCYISQASVIVVPLLSGGGTRFKIVEAMALGKAIVSTPKGCEGIEVQDGVHLLIREIEEFPEAILTLFRQPDLRKALGYRARELVKEKYSWLAAAKIIKERLTHLTKMEFC